MERTSALLLGALICSPLTSQYIILGIEALRGSMRHISDQLIAPMGRGPEWLQSVASKETPAIPTLAMVMNQCLLNKKLRISHSNQL